MRRTRQKIDFSTHYQINENSTFKLEQLFEVDVENPCEYIARTDCVRFVKYDNERRIVDLFECEPALMVKLIAKKTGLLVKF